MSTTESLQGQVDRYTHATHVATLVHCAKLASAYLYTEPV